MSTQDVERVVKLETQANNFMFGGRSFSSLSNDFFMQSNILEELSKLVAGNTAAVYRRFFYE